MNRETTQQQMIDYVTGEMGPAERAAFASQINGDAKLADELAGLQRATGALRDAAPDADTGDLERRIMAAVRAEAAGAAAPARPAGAPAPATRWRLWGPIAAVAAAVLFAMLVYRSAETGTSIDPLGGSVAWADVVEAMQGVRAFHAVAWADEPRNARMPNMYKIEMYYRAPGMYRAHGFDRVQFLRDGHSRMYDAAERKWVDAERSAFRLIPRELIGKFEQEGLLSALLAMMFRGNPPEGVPVASATVEASAGIAVFDYAHDPNKQWARIWVLKESRLPIRMQLYQPQWEDSMLVVFDYTDPQPESFFDPDHFEQVVTERRLRNPRAIMRAGAEKLQGKPIGMEQTYDPDRGVKVPEVVSVESATTGDLLVTTRHPKNIGPDGRGLPPGFADQAFDNWGNTYFRVAPSSWSRLDDADEFTDKPIRSVYMLVPPMRVGEGPRTARLRYTYWGPVSATSARATMNGDVLAGERQVAVREADEPGIPADWPGRNDLVDPVRRARALYSFHLTRSPLWVQLGSLTSLDPMDPDGYQILRHYDLWDEYAAVYERDRLDAALADPFADGQTMEHLGQYMLHLRRSGRADAFDALHAKLAPMEAAFLKKDPDPRHPDEREPYRNYRMALPLAMALPRAVAAVDAGDGPRVVEAVRSRDGYAVVVTETPPSRNRNSSDDSWSWGRLAEGQGWSLVKVHSADAGRDQPRRRTWLLRGDGPDVRFSFDIMIVAALDDPKAREAFTSERFAWDLVAALPEADAADQAALLAAFPDVADKPDAEDGPYQQILRRIIEQRAAGEHEPVIASYQALLALPRERWPEHYRNDDASYETVRENYELRIAEARVALGELDEAQRIIDRIADATPTEADASPAPRYHRWTYLNGCYATLLKALIARGDLDRARALLERLEARRPDWRLALDEHVVVATDMGTYGSNPAFHLWSAWKPIDIAWLRLAQARTGEILPAHPGPPD